MDEITQNYRPDPSLMRDSQGRWRVNIFKEYQMMRNFKDPQSPPILTMRSNSYQGLPSARSIYINSIDEYEAAMKIVGTWEHWQRLLRSKDIFEGIYLNGRLIHEGIKHWREEQKLRQQSQVKMLLLEAAESGNVSAQRALYGADEDKKAGRPSKAKVQAEATKLAQESDIIKSAQSRVKLAVNNVKDSPR